MSAVVHRAASVGGVTPKTFLYGGQTGSGWVEGLNLGGVTVQGRWFVTGVAPRLNLLYHDVDTPGRDHVETQRIGFAPSVAVGLGRSTPAILTHMLLGQDKVPHYFHQQALEGNLE